VTDFHDLISFWVDFNSIRHDGTLPASLRFSSGPRVPAIGEVVILHDHDGNQCEGRVVARRGRIVDVEPDRSTWAVLGALELHRGAIRAGLSTHWASPTDNESSRLRPLTIA
jgi:hypothetical protein